MKLYLKDENRWVEIPALKGDRGSTVVSVDKVSTEGNVDTYEMVFDDGQTFSFTVTNGHANINADEIPMSAEDARKITDAVAVLNAAGVVSQVNAPMQRFHNIFVVDEDERVPGLNYIVERDEFEVWVIKKGTRPPRIELKCTEKPNLNVLYFDEYGIPYHYDGTGLVPMPWPASDEIAHGDTSVELAIDSKADKSIMMQTEEEFVYRNYDDTYENAEAEIISLKGNTALWGERIYTFNPERIITASEWYESESIYTFQFSGIMHNGEQMFPDGLLRAGDVFDEITDNVAIKRVGMVDLGTLDWHDVFPEYGCFNALVPNLKRATSTRNLCNILCSGGYEQISPTSDDFKRLPKTIACMYNNPYVYCSNSSIHTVEEFKQALSGVMLCYELATPIIEELDNYDNKFTVYKRGNAYVDDTVVEMIATIKYKRSSADTVAKLNEDVDYLYENIDNKANKEELAMIDERVGIATQLAEQAEEIAKGRATGYVFDTKADMDAWLLVQENKDKLVLGDNLYIKAVDVPDYWWDGTSPQMLETQKVDLSEYVKNTDYASSVKSGVVRVGDGLSIITSGSYTGQIFVNKASNTQIDAKTNSYYPIVPSNLDYAVKTSIADNKLPLTATEQSNAQKWLGFKAITFEQYEALTDKTGINFVYPIDYVEE